MILAECRELYRPVSAHSAGMRGEGRSLTRRRPDPIATRQALTELIRIAGPAEKRDTAFSRNADRSADTSPVVYSAARPGARQLKLELLDARPALVADFFVGVRTMLRAAE